jgi:NTE family protein
MINYFGKKKKKIGLALGSGAAKGLAHIGVIKALEEKNVHIDMIAGSSIGAIVGACYAMTGSIRDIEALVLKVDWKKLTKLLDPNIALFFKGVMYGKKVKDFLKTIIGDVEFKDLKIPLAVVATDADTGEEVVIDKGSVLDAVRASISIPGIFTPVKYGNRFLMDGGVINPVPVSVVKNMGADFIIACNVIQIPKKGYKENGVTGKNVCKIAVAQENHNQIVKALNDNIDRWVHKNNDKIKKIQKFIHMFKTKYIKAEEIDAEAPSLFDAVIRTLYIMEYELVLYKMHGADIIINPDTRCISQVDFNRGKEAIIAGYEATQAALNKNKRYIV